MRIAHQLIDLNARECLQLLGATRIARLAFTDRALPMVLPVHSLLRGQELIVGGPTGNTIAGAVDGDVVAVVVDAYQPDTREGWCVSVVGRVRLITDPQEITELDALEFAPWAPDQQQQYFAIGITVIRGHRLTRRTETGAVPTS
jgi:uncharacterized protein